MLVAALLWSIQLVSGCPVWWLVWSLQTDCPPPTSLQDSSRPQLRSQQLCVYLQHRPFDSLHPLWLPAELPRGNTQREVARQLKHRLRSRLEAGPAGLWMSAPNDGSEVSCPLRPGGPHTLLHSCSVQMVKYLSNINASAGPFDEPSVDSWTKHS